MNTTVTVNKWGKSLGIRIPKDFADKMQVKEGKKMEIVLAEGEMKLKPVMTLDWLMEGITPENKHELLLDDTLVGQEQW